MAFVDKIIFFLFCLHLNVDLSDCVAPNGDMQDAVRNLTEDAKGMKGKFDMGSLDDLVYKLIGQVGEIKEVVESIKGSVDKMESKVDTLEKSDAKMQERVETIQKSDAKMELRVEDIARDVGNEKKELEKRVKVSTMNDKIKEVDEKRQKVQKELKSELLNKTNVINKEIKHLKSRGLIDRLFPVNSIHITFANVGPPMQGEYGVMWERLPEGYVLMTGNTGNVGKRTGSERLDVGKTNGHTLNVEEMPSHSHGYSYFYEWYHHEYDDGSGSDHDASTVHRTSASTASTGGNRAHDHTLDIFNQKVLVWKRTS